VLDVAPPVFHHGHLNTRKHPLEAVEQVGQIVSRYQAGHAQVELPRGGIGALADGLLGVAQRGQHLVSVAQKLVPGVG
jgi:hypothetical protein